MNDLLFYDIEVFQHDSLVVFKDIDKKVKQIFVNDFVGLAEFIEGKTLVGFNNYHYDDKVLTYMLELKPQHLIKQLNDKIISGKSVRYINQPPFKSLDVFQQIDVSMPSLKKIEGNWGRMIKESSISFTIDRPLTPEELNEVLDYCAYDVDTTIDVYKIRDKSYFQPKQSLLEMLGNEKAAKWNTTTISANLLLDKPLGKWSEIKIDPELWEKVPENVQALWRAKSKYWDAPKKLEKFVTVEDFGCELQFGFGGLHGAHKTIKKQRNVKLLDVTSMYPNIILILMVLGKATMKYKAILDRRIAVKYVDPVLSEALKLILNSVFGNLNNRYSLLYNPMALFSVCIYGQIALYDLCKRISPFATILNINTDGVAFIPHDNDTGYIAAYEEWQKDFSLQLEEKNFDLLVQKDVNNYIAVKKDKIICKGGDVNRFEEDALFKNNNARILDIALCEFLVNGVDPLTTIEAHIDQPHLFQYILKAGNTYLSTADEKGKEYNKVNRVFASKEGDLCLFKKRHDEGLVRFADAPQRMFLHNDDCSEIVDFAEKIDLNHYLQLVKKRVERWT